MRALRGWGLPGGSGICTTQHLVVHRKLAGGNHVLPQSLVDGAAYLLLEKKHLFEDFTHPIHLINLVNQCPA